VPVDPGEHSFAFEAESGARAEQHLLVLEGDKNRKVRVILAASVASPEAVPAPVSDTRPSDEPARDASSPPWPVYPLGAVGVLGVAGFVTFGLLGRAQQSDLDARRGTCSDHAYDIMRNRYLAADIARDRARISGSSNGPLDEIANLALTERGTPRARRAPRRNPRSTASSGRSCARRASDACTSGAMFAAE
jgi:hypothetical protein